MLTLREKHEYEQEIAQLKGDIEKLKYLLFRANENKSKIKCRYEKLKAKHRPKKLV